MTERTAPLNSDKPELQGSMLRGIASALIMGLNTFFWCSLLLPLALIKLISPGRWLRARIRRILGKIAEQWISVNNWIWQNQPETQWNVDIQAQIDRKRSYMLIANHQSWVDIMVLQRVLHQRAPLLRFFLKHELIYVPIMGLAWWALDFPFLKRYSKDQIAKNPKLKNKDVRSALRACRKFRHIPVTLMNFVEGTRITEDKHARSKSPYVHLLPPKVGGFALSLSALQNHVSAVIDVTIVYPDGVPTLWDLLCGRVEKIDVLVKQREIPEQLIRIDTHKRDELKAQAAQWLNQLWVEKDQTIDALLTEAL